MKINPLWSVVFAIMFFLSACGQSGPTWQEQYDLGIRYLEDGNYEEAIIAFTAAIEIDPKRAPAYIGRGDAYIGFGETEENLAAALADYEAAIELDETNAQAYLGLADVYIRKGDYDKALEVLWDGLEKTGNDQAIVDKLAEMERGNITDSSGRIRRECTYDVSGNLMYIHTHDYDEQGRQSAVTSYDSAGVQTGHVDIGYDAAGNQLNNYHWGDDGVVGRMDNEYDSAGNLVKQTHYSIQGDMELYYAFQYNENGKCTRENQYYSTGELMGYKILEYNAAGQKVKESGFGPDGALHGYFLFEYNSADDRVKYSSYSADGALNWYWVSRYDDQGNYLGEERYDGDGNLTQSTVIDQ